MGKRSDEFCDYYELLQVSPNADEETVHRIFRHLAKQFHPDAPGGDAERFELLAEAYRTLKDPEARAAYDVKHREFWARTWKVAKEAPDEPDAVDDEALRGRMLSLLYTQRRSDSDKPGLGEIALVRLLECPAEFVEFHIWYLKEKGWIARLETGALAITAEGVDQVEANRGRLDPTLLISTNVDPKKTADSAG